MSTTYGYSTSEWETARDWLTRRLHRVAQRQDKMTYSEVCDKLRAAGVLDLEPHSSALAALLGQINLLEHEEGRPLISAVVVHKEGDWLPGEGFWTFARDLGIDSGATESARFEFWVQEFGRCHDYWRNRP